MLAVRRDGPLLAMLAGLRAAVLVLLPLASACEDGAAAAPELDLSMSGADLAAAAALGVPCAAARCFNAANQYCHTSDWGRTGSCEMRSSPGTGYFACDGPEDCSSGACCLLAGASVCGAFGFCVAAQTVGEFMCHGDLECGASSKCCAKSAAGPYRVCVDGLGPEDPCPAR